MKAILVTACPAGIATSFLAAKRIEQQAKLAGWELTLDVGSSVQPRQVPSKEQIAAAELVLVVASAPVDLAAYDGKRVYQGSMDLALFCTRLKTRLDEEGGEISLHYQMDLNGQFAASHEMEIRLMRQNEAHE